jgi:hypothetical protein
MAKRRKKRKKPREHWRRIKTRRGYKKILINKGIRPKQKIKRKRITHHVPTFIDHLRDTRGKYALYQHIDKKGKPEILLELSAGPLVPIDLFEKKRKEKKARIAKNRRKTIERDRRHQYVWIGGEQIPKSNKYARKRTKKKVKRSMQTKSSSKPSFEERWEEYLRKKEEQGKKSRDNLKSLMNKKIKEKIQKTPEKSMGAKLIEIEKIDPITGKKTKEMEMIYGELVEVKDPKTGEKYYKVKK